MTASTLVRRSRRARVRAHYRSLVEHPPFSPLVLRAWIPLGVASLLVIVVAAHVDSPFLLLAGFVLGSVAAPIAFLVDLQYRTGLAWHPPRAMLLLGVIVGGPLAMLVSSVAQHGFPAIGPNPQTVLIGPIEEAAKLLVPALVLLVHRASQRGALICAVAAAASFQAIENVLMAYGVLVHGDGGVAASTGVLVARGLVGPFTHCMWTATVAVAWFGSRPDRRVLADPRLRRLAIWFVLVAATHSAWDVATGVEQQLPALSLAALAFGGTLAAHQVATRDAARHWSRARRAGVGRD